MKNKKITKRLVAVCAALLAIILSLPMYCFASGGTYCVYEDFETQTSVDGFKAYLQPNQSDAGRIALDTTKKCLVYDKTVNVSGQKAFYTDVFFTPSRAHCEAGSKFVFEVTFWYTGDISNATWGEFVGARKEVDGKVDMKCLLQISGGKLYTGAGKESKDLVTNLSANTKYSIAVAVDDSQHQYDVYLNGNAVKTDVSYTTKGTYFTCIRGINCTSLAVPEGSTLPDFYADDFKLYYADKPICAGGVPSSSPGGATNNGGATGGDTNTDNGGADTQAPVIPAPSVPDNSGSENNGVGQIKLPKVEQKEFEFTAAPQQSTEVESDPIVLEKTKDIIFIVSIGGGSAAVIALVIIFGKKFV